MVECNYIVSWFGWVTFVGLEDHAFQVPSGVHVLVSGLRGRLGHRNQWPVSWADHPCPRRRHRQCWSYQQAWHWRRGHSLAWNQTGSSILSLTLAIYTYTCICVIIIIFFFLILLVVGTIYIRIIIIIRFFNSLCHSRYIYTCIIIVIFFLINSSSCWDYIHIRIIIIISWERHGLMELHPSHNVPLIQEKASSTGSTLIR